VTGETQHPVARFWRRNSLILLLGLAFLLRLAAIVAFPGNLADDEIFQSLEQAHRLAFGYGLKTWEFYFGVRSYLPVYILVSVFKATAVFTSDPAVLIGAVRCLLALLSLLPVAAAWRYGRQFSRTHALVAGLFTAIWFEIVCFSFRPLTEAVAFDFLFAAMCLAPVARPRHCRRHALFIGAALAACAMLRIQLLPAVLFVALVANGRTLSRRTTLILAGAAIPLAAFALVDVFTWGWPFAFIYNAININVVHDVASHFGIKPASFYFGLITYRQPAALLLLVPLLAYGFRRYRTPILTAGIILAAHLLIPHKEYRFVFAAYSILWFGAALASTDLARRFAGRWAGAILIVFWCLLSADFADTFPELWNNNRGVAKSEFWLARQSDLCGVGFHRIWIMDTGGYSHLHRRVPLMFAQRGTKASVFAVTQTYNYVLLPAAQTKILPATYHIAVCNADVCVAKRSGGCSPAAVLPPGLVRFDPDRPPSEPIEIPPAMRRADNSTH
jgi:hypothetical protein